MHEREGERERERGRRRGRGRAWRGRERERERERERKGVLLHEYRGEICSKWMSMGQAVASLTCHPALGL